MNLKFECLHWVWIVELLIDIHEHGVSCWARVFANERTIDAFYSPNIAKEIHIGQLLSINICDNVAYMIKYCNVIILWHNQVGDWCIHVLINCNHSNW
jgi:arginyl-tRNA synthetase